MGPYNETIIIAMHGSWDSFGGLTNHCTHVLENGEDGVHERRLDGGG